MAGKVLLIGINIFKFIDAPLNGCVNDTELWINLINKKMFNNLPTIHILKNEEATRSNIIAEMEWLCDNPGEYAFLGQSSHGVQFPDKEERDGLAEAFCPYDFQWRSDAMILDDDYINIFGVKMAKNVSFFMNSDSCHSGGISSNRGLEKPSFFAKIKSWFNRNPMEFPRTIPNHLIPGEILKKIFARLSVRKNRSITNSVLDIGYSSGCRSNQTSADTVIDGMACGADTYHLTKTLAANWDLPYLKVIELTRQSLKSARYSQEPQCEGNYINRKFIR